MGWKNKKNDLSGLLEDTPEAYYWIGFLMADGCFSSSNRAMKICLSLGIKDFNHLSLTDREMINFDHPDSLDTDLLITHHYI